MQGQLRLDDLSPGVFIVVTELDLPEPEYNPYGYFGGPSSRRRGHGMNGMPMEILAIELPFIAVAYDDERKDVSTIDVRECRLRRVGKKYVQVMRKGRKPKKVKPDKPVPTGDVHMFCGRCGSVNKFIGVNNATKWVKRCPNCGHQEDLPPGHPIRNR